MKKPDFLDVNTGLQKLEVDWKMLRLAWFKNGCGHSVLRTLKLAVCQGEMNGINCFLMCWYKFRKAKSYFNNFLVVVVKNGCGLLGLGTLKSVVSQEPIDEMSWFFACW